MGGSELPGQPEPPGEILSQKNKNKYKQIFSWEYDLIFTIITTIASPFLFQTCSESYVEQ